jgi:hypothetical protein
MISFYRTALVFSRIASVCLLGLPHSSAAQGCEPIRFTTPVDLGGGGEAYQRTGEWDLSLDYRRLVSTEYFVGTRSSPTLAPGGSPPLFHINTFVASVGYSFNDRFRLRASLPFQTATLSRTWPDKLVHEQHATGIGDVGLLGDMWLFSPRNHQDGNIAIGLGMKAPSGSHTISSTYYTASGPVAFPADQTIQPGDGGWAVLFDGQAFQRISDRTIAYASGSYMASPKGRSDVQSAPNSGQYWSVPDVFSARLGTAVAVLPDQGLSLSLGGRTDGIPVHDMVGGGDATTVKRSAYVLFAEPGLSLTRGSGVFTLSVPYRLRVDRVKSELEQSTNALNGGGFAKYLVFAGYTFRL